jgi:hypothetical protein
MKLDLNLLENVKERGARYQSACPACREGGSDKAGDNLVIFENGNFACAALQSDKEHSKRILQIAGAKTDWRPGAPPPLRRTRTAPDPEVERKLEWWRGIRNDITRWRSALYDNHQALAFFAGELGLNPETLQDLTGPAFDAVALAPAGFVPLNAKGALREPRLAIVYDGAVKVRDPWRGSKVRFTMSGTPRRPWRSFWLKRPELSITEVHVVESESDALALIDAGFERPFEERGSCVVAVPGASSWRDEWSVMLAGRDVHLWPDQDTAGSAFCDAVGASCRTISNSIKKHNLAEITL